MEPKKLQIHKKYLAILGVSSLSLVFGYTAYAQTSVDSLRNAYKSYVQPAPVKPVVVPKPPTTTVSTISSAALTSALRSLITSGLPEDIKNELRGPQGAQGPAGPMGPSGNPGYTFSQIPPTNNSNSPVGLIGGFASLGVQSLETNNITITNNITQTGGNASLKGLTVTGLQVNGTTNFGGSSMFTGDMTVNGNITLSGTNNLLVGGQGTFTHVPTLAHTFSPWPTGTSNIADSSLFVNPVSSIADGNLIAAAVNGVAKFIVDAEGDIYGNNLILTGSTSAGSTVIGGDLTVQDNSTLGDSGSDLINLNGGINTNILFATDNNRDIGASTASRPRKIFAGTSIVAPSSLLTNIPTQPEGSVTWFGETITSLSPNIIAIEDTSTSNRFEAQHIKLLVNPSGAVNNRKTGLFVDAETVAGNAQNNSSSVRGIYVQTHHAGSGSLTEMTGIDTFNSTQQGAGNITDLIGGRFISSLGGSSATISRAYGVKAQVQMSAGGQSNITQAIGVQSDIINAGATGRIPLAIGFYANTTGLGSKTDVTVGYWSGNLTGNEQYAFYNEDSDAPMLSLAPFQREASSLGTTSTDGFYAYNATAATNGSPVQISPRSRWAGTGWDTDDSVSRNVSFVSETIPISGVTVSGAWKLGYIDPVSSTLSYPMTILSGGSVGIGTENPQAKIHVVGTTEQLRLAYDASNYSSFTTGSAGQLTVTSGGTNQNITLAPSGTGRVVASVNAGAGNGFVIDFNESQGDQKRFYFNAGTGNSPQAMTFGAFDKVGYGGGIVFNKVGVAGEVGLINGYGNGLLSANTNAVGLPATVKLGGSTPAWSGYVDESISLIATPGLLTIAQNGSGNLRDISVRSMFTSGNVGIGSASPGVLLDVTKALGVGDQNIARFLNTDGNAHIFIGKAASSNNNLRIGFDDTEDYGYMRIGDDNPGRGINITYGANWGVGIGTTAPATKLHVAGLGGQTTEGASPALIIGGSQNGSAVGSRQELNFRSWNGLNGSTAGIGIITTDIGANELADLYFTTKTTTGATTATEKMRITAAGKVGIGTTNPDDKLHVMGGEIVVGDTTEYHIETGGTELELRYLNSVMSTYSGNASTGEVKFGPGAGSGTFWLTLQSNGGEYMRLKDGMIGINTTADNATRLAISEIDGNNRDHLRLINNTAVTGKKWALNSEDNGSFTIKDASGALGKVFNINNAGYVGIGTTNPSLGKLQVETSSGNAAVTINANAGGVVAARSEYAKSGTVEWLAGYGAYTGGSGYEIGTFTTSPGAKMTILTNGNLGIGTTNPGAQLHVETGNGEIARFKSTATNGSYASFYKDTSSVLFWGSRLAITGAGGQASEGIIAGGHSGDGGHLFIYGNYNVSTSAIELAAGVMRVVTDNSMSSGDGAHRWSAVYAVNGTIQTSDIREKHNIINTQLGLNFINKLRPVQYEYNDIAGKREGFIAQEVIAALDGNPFEGGLIYNQETDRYGLNYAAFVAPLTKAIQELDLKITGVEERITALEAASGGGNQGWYSMASDFFSEGIKSIGDGVVYMRALVIDTLKVGSPEKRTGITLYDEVTGDPYCVSVANGAQKTTPGECQIFEPAQPPSPAPEENNPPAEEPSDSPTEGEPEVTPADEPQDEPAPENPPTPEETPQPEI